MTTEILVAWSPFGRRVIAVWERVLRLSRRAPKRLRLCESLPLGERRFVAVVEFDEARFLVGGTPSSLVLLSRLQDAGKGKQAEDESEKAPSNAAAEVEMAKEIEVKIKKRRGERC